MKRPLNSVLVIVVSLVTALPVMAQQNPLGKRKTSPKRPKLSALEVARERILNSKPLAMYYYIGDARGLKSMAAHGSRMGLLAPQSYWITREGAIRGELPPHAAEEARRLKLAIMPLVFNRGFDREIVTALLHDPAAQLRAASEMAELAVKEGFVGFQIDLENIAPGERALFTDFVRQAADRLHQDGRLLSVTIVPKFTDALPESSPAPTMGQWAAAYDYRALGDIADFVTLMTYDHFSRLTGAGPIAGYEWVRKSLDFTVARIPPDKILLGIPLYGREWMDLGDRTLSRSLDAREIGVLRARWKPATQWDDRWRSPWFQFKRRKAVHTVWYEDRRSWSAKLGLISEYHLRGFSAWRLGFEGPNFWSLSGIRPPIAKKTASRRTGTARASKGEAAKPDSKTQGRTGPSR